MRIFKSKNHIKILFVLIILLLHFALMSSPLIARDVEWITVEGAASMDHISKEEARKLAIEDAMRKAVQKAVGANISAQMLIVNLRLSGSIIGAIPYGKVIDQKILEEGVINQKNKGSDTISMIYKVRMKASVSEETTGSDPHFKIDASLNKTSFKDGDEMLIRIKPNEDCYISIFTIFDDEKVLRLIPNNFKKDNHLKANEVFLLPDDEDRKKGITIKVHAPKQKDNVSESIYVLALKQPFNLGNMDIQEGIFGLYDGQTAFMNDLIEEIVNIPLKERAEKLIPYQISKK